MSKHCPKLQDVNYLQKRIILQRSHHEHLEIRNNVKFLANIRVWFQNDRCRVKFNDDAFFNQLYTHQTCWQPPLPVLKKYRIQDWWINECNRKTVIILLLLVYVILDICNSLFFLFYAVLCIICDENVLYHKYQCTCVPVMSDSYKSHSVKVTVVEWSCHTLY